MSCFAYVLLYGTGGRPKADRDHETMNSDGTTIDPSPSWRFGWAAGTVAR